jgi:hypothetical protein
LARAGKLSRNEMILGQANAARASRKQSGERRPAIQMGSAVPRDLRSLWVALAPALKCWAIVEGPSGQGIGAVLIFKNPGGHWTSSVRVLQFLTFSENVAAFHEPGCERMSHAKTQRRKGIRERRPDRLRLQLRLRLRLGRRRTNRRFVVPMRVGKTSRLYTKASVEPFATLSLVTWHPNLGR